MKRIIINKRDDGTIHITSDENLIGEESWFTKNITEPEQFIIALANFLGYEPAELLNFDWDEIDKETMKELGYDIDEEGN